jgi:ferritin-like metal-binding protein YciE
MFGHTPPENLKDIYIEEMRDLWSANDQMHKIMGRFAESAGNAKLKQMFEKAMEGIGRHTDTLKALIEKNGGKTSTEYCRGMEGLVREAKRHALDSSIKDSDVRDALLISQYQRMTHYGLAGFGTAAAYAKALGLTEDEAQLKQATSEIYKGDEVASQVAETSVNLAAKYKTAT